MIISEPHKTDFHFCFKIPICFHWRTATCGHRMKNEQIKRKEILFTIIKDPSDPSNNFMYDLIDMSSSVGLYKTHSNFNMTRWL